MRGRDLVIASLMMLGQPTAYTIFNDVKKPHWKETQSEEDKKSALAKAEGKRQRKAKRKKDHESY